MELLFMIPIKIASIVHITRQVIIAHTGIFAVRICRKITLAISPVITRTMGLSSTIAFSPGGFIKNQRNRIIF